MQRRSGNFGMRGMGTPVQHPEPEQLLALIDRELPWTQQVSVRAHLLVCRHCRAELHALRTTSKAFSRHNLFPELDQSGAAYSNPAIPQPYAQSEVHQTPASVSLQAGLFGRPTGTAALALSLALLIFWSLVLTPPRLTAMEVIERARAAEQIPLQAVKNAQVQRLLQASRRIDGVIEQQLSHEEVWNGLPGSVRHVDHRNVLLQDLSNVLPVSECEGISPFSVRMMQCLAEHHATRSRVVSSMLDKSPERYQLAIDCARPERGHPFTSIWHLRVSDWQLVSVDFHFFTYPAEVSYRVELVTQFITEGRTEVASRSRAVAPTVSDTQPVVSQEAIRQSDQASLQLRMFLALQSMGLSPDDEIRMSWEDGTLRILAIVPDDLRKWQLEQQVAHIAGVDSTVYSYHDLTEGVASTMAPQAENGPFPEKGEGNEKSALRGEGPLLHDALLGHFGRGEQGEEAIARLSNLVLESTQSVGFQMRWLSRIRDTFPPAVRHSLSAEERISLELLEAEVLREIAAGHDGMSQGLRQAVCPTLCSSAAAKPLGAAGQESLSRTIGDNEAREVRALLSQLEEEFVVLKTLFVDRGFAEQRDTHQDAGTAILRWLETSQSVSRQLRVTLTSMKPEQVRATR
jgi:hypothetical protein